MCPGHAITSGYGGGSRAAQREMETILVIWGPVPSPLIWGGVGLAGQLSLRLETILVIRAQCHHPRHGEGVGRRGRAAQHETETMLMIPGPYAITPDTGRGRRGRAGRMWGVQSGRPARGLHKDAPTLVRGLHSGTPLWCLLVRKEHRVPGAPCLPGVLLCPGEGPGCQGPTPGGSRVTRRWARVLEKLI